MLVATMAKARKQQKNEEQQKAAGITDESAAAAAAGEAVVRHQKLCLSIDMDKRRIYGSLFLFLFRIFNFNK